MADTTTAQPLVSFKKRVNKATARRKVATPPPASDTDSDFASSEDENGRQVKRRKKTTGIVSNTPTIPKPLESSDQVSTLPQPHQTDNDVATKRSNWYDNEHDKEHVKQPKSTEGDPDGTYKGTAAYTSFIKPDPSRSTLNIGPQKLNSNVRTITVTDFAPDVCKDYKQTGFCGFGDSCKFLHAREDYKQGWQLDRDWEVSTKGKTLTGRTVASADRNMNKNEPDDNDEKTLDSIPFACIICKESYKSPIITKCGHYFCESCALKRYRKDPSCAACGASTSGVFNVAKKLNLLLDRKREREKSREAASSDGQG